MSDENPDYDHDFVALRVCEECGNDESGCVCEEDEQDLQNQAECDVCGKDEDDTVHQEEV